MFVRTPRWVWYCCTCVLRSSRRTGTTTSGKSSANAAPVSIVWTMFATRRFAASSVAAMTSRYFR